MKNEVNFNRLGTDYCLLLHYNCKLKWVCSLGFIFYFYSSFYTRLPSPFNMPYTNVATFSLSAILDL